jgi:hypothetical protein
MVGLFGPGDWAKAGAVKAMAVAAATVTILRITKFSLITGFGEREKRRS